MDFELPEELVKFQSEVQQYVQESLVPHAAALDREEKFPEAQIQRAAEIGLLGILVPEEFGGSARGNLAGSMLVEETSRACPSTSVTLSVHNSLVCTPLSRHGTEVTKKKYLPDLASGKLLGAYALSEAFSGSDAAALRCRAEKKGDHYVLNGAKLWITSGTHAGLFIVFARTSDLKPGEKNSRGISAFLVESKFPGFSIGKKEDKLGIRASSTVEILLDQCEVPEENLLGTLDRGFRIAMETLDGGRIGIASQALGIAQGCLDASREYLAGRPELAARQSMQWKLAEIAMQVDASRLMIRRAALLRDQGKPCTKEAAMAKLMASTMCNFAANEAVDVHGMDGYLQRYAVERLLRDARITEIYEGTTEVQHLVIARSVMAGS